MPTLAGAGLVCGGAATVGVGRGWFSRGGWGTFVSGGGFLGGPGHARRYPRDGWPYPFAVGAYGGAGFSGWYTNADRVSQLRGNFHNISVNVGAPFIPWIRFTASISWADNGIYMVNVGPPFVGLGAGFGIFQHDTDTRTWGR